MEETALKSYVCKCEKTFVRFMDIPSMPEYEIIVNQVSLEHAINQGFGSPAAAFYDIALGSHQLKISPEVTQLGADYLIFHEFTHILDAEMYSRKNKIQHMSNRGFTEFHAAQVDFMKLLGASSINEPLSFSMTKKVRTLGGVKTAMEFLKAPHDLATSLIEREDFPANIETLATALGLIFNYYGRRSICKMYAFDYEEQPISPKITELIHDDGVKALDIYMIGFFDEVRIKFLNMFFQRIAISLAQHYKLG